VSLLALAVALVTAGCSSYVGGDLAPGAAAYVYQCRDLNPTLDSVYGTNDGQHLWAVGVGGTILESVDGGEHWSPRASGTQNP
jgi:photosystem II stability/assembly factor-like uncharacterized protein